jgi:hypothetical protein
VLIVKQRRLLYNKRPMREKLPQHPIIRKERPDYGAVPLEPWTAVEERRRGLGKKRETYFAASVLRITSRIDTAMSTAAQQYGWVGSPELSGDLRNLIETSLYDSQRRRMEFNPGVLDSGMVDMDDARVETAKNGTATPFELLGLLADYPKLGSLELAKLSHPLDSTATEEMDAEVRYALACKRFDFIDAPGRYKTKTARPHIPAVTILRKQTIAELDLPDGLLQVVQRKAFLVRGDEEACQENDIHLDRLVRNPDRHDELYEKIEGWYPYTRDLSPEWDRSRKWLQPLATSYYAKYATPESDATK